AGRPAPVDLRRERAIHDAVRAAREAGLVASAHDCSEGGLAVTLAECCLTAPGAPLGASITLEAEKTRLDALLFGEAPSRVVVSTAPENRARLEALLSGLDLPHRVLGAVGGKRLDIKVGRTSVREADALSPQREWTEALPRLLRG